MIGTSIYKLQNAEKINLAISDIPKAELKSICRENGEVMERWKRVEVVNNDVAVVTKQYKLVQHEQAFRPIIEGLALRGAENFKFNLFYNHKRAWMNIYIGEGYDNIKYGFRIMNSVDRSTSVRYGLSAFTETRILELVGYRLTCQNGMIVRVNLDDAEFVREEERIKIDELLAKKIAFKHSGDVEKKIEEVQYIVEAFTLLKNPLKRIIEKSQSIELTKKQAEDFVKKYVGQRKLDKVMEKYGYEEQTLWGLYNAITFIASHAENIKVSNHNRLLVKAADMLEQELALTIS